jgi:hypothetical protein
MFWFILLTWPVGILFTIVWGIVLFLHRRGWRKRSQVPA